MAIALETQGVEAARPWVERAKATYPVLVDQHNLLGQLLDFKMVPNGVFLDEHGIMRYAKYGGFSVDNVEDREAIHDLIDGKQPQQPPAKPHPYQLSSVARELIETRLRLAAELLAQGQTEAALAEWQRALEFDPQNFIIRKQIWAVKYPERFHPVIDWDWQRDQLRREQETEIARGVCGPNGCPIPQAYG